jgi:hypothetical protein
MPDSTAPRGRLGIQTQLHHRREEVEPRRGTSFSAPHVTGAVALLRQIDPQLTPDAIEELLRVDGTSDRRQPKRRHDRWRSRLRTSCMPWERR